MAVLGEITALFAALLFVASSVSSAAPPPAVPKEPRLRIETGSHSALVTRVSVDAQGRFLSTASEDKTSRVWDLASGQLLAVLRPPIGDSDEGKLLAAAISPDGRTVAVGGQTGASWGEGRFALYIFDRATGRILDKHTLLGLEAPITSLTWSADGRYLIVGLRETGLRVFRSDLGFVGADGNYNEAIFSVSASADGRFAVASLDGSVRLYRIGSKGLESGPARRLSGKPYGISFSPDASLLAVGYQDAAKVELLRGDNLEPRRALEVKARGNLGRVAWAADGRTLYAAGSAVADGHFALYAFAVAGSGEGREIGGFSNIVLSLASLPDGGVVAGTAEPSWAAFDANGQQRLRVASTTQDFRDAVLLVSPDARQIGFTRSKGEGLLFDGVRASLTRIASAPGLAGPRMDGGLQVEGWRNTVNPRLNGQRLAGVLPQEPSRSLAMASDNRFVLGTEWYLRAFDAGGRPLWNQPIPGAAWAVNISGDGRWVVAALGDGTLRWYRFSDGREQLALFPQADANRWIVWTPSGYYDTSLGGETLIGWHLNRAYNKESDFFSVSRFRGIFYRPDVIARVWQTGDEAEALRPATVAKPSPLAPQPVPVAAPAAPLIADALPPVVELQGDSVIESTAAVVPVRFQVRSSADTPVAEVKVRVNNQLVQTLNETAARRMVGSAQEMRVEVPPEADGEITIYARNEHGISEPARVLVKRPAKPAAPAAAVAAAVKPYKTLYLLGIGVGQAYPGGVLQKLDFPAKDAADFAKSMAAQQGKLYTRVEQRLLLDAQATRQSILQGLAWLEEKTGKDDVAVLFMAGHGYEKNGSYIFVPSDAAISSEDALMASGVPAAAISKALVNVRGRPIFFIDTCHSGFAVGQFGVQQSSSQTAVTNSLEDEKAVIVFSASAGKQSSLESPEWGNGAFTKAIVEGLGGNAEYYRMGKPTGRITPSSLGDYVSDRVTDLTEKQQTPKINGAFFNDPIAITLRK